MNGMEKLTDAAARHGWTLKDNPRGWSRTVHYLRGAQQMEVYRRADGGVTYASRNWGPRTTAVAPKVADQVLTWMQEPTPDDGTDRGFFFRLATGHGWTFKGIDSGDVYTWSAHRITLRFRTHQSVLGDAQRNFGGRGEARSFATNVPANITPWFHAFLDEDAQVCDCPPSAGARHVATLKEGVPAKPSQEPAKPVVRSAVPNTPDRKLRRLVEELDRTTTQIYGDVEKFRRVGLTGDFTVAELEELSVRLERLAQDARHASREAALIVVEREFGPTAAASMRKVYAREDGRA